MMIPKTYYINVIETVQGSTDITIGKIEFDSRKIEK
jgi:hypothetical protein